MKSKAPLTIVLASLLWCTSHPAKANDRYVSSGNGFVIVWKDSDSLWEGFKLIEAGVLKTNPELIERLIACVVNDGSQVVVTDAGIVTNDIVIIEGDSTGCRGNVSIDRISLKSGK